MYELGKIRYLAKSLAILHPWRPMTRGALHLHGHLWLDANMHLSTLLFGERIKPKQAQVECIQRIIFNRQDVILMAKTGFGKSLIMQSVSFFFKRGVTIRIFKLPLNAESAIPAAGGFEGVVPQFGYVSTLTQDIACITRLLLAHNYQSRTGAQRRSPTDVHRTRV
jgi:hypothetical protein